MTREPTHVERGTAGIVALVLLGGLLALGTTVAVAWVAGFHDVLRETTNVAWIWLPLAIGGQLLAYLGYGLAYREVARVEGGPELEATRVAALVATGFGVFILRGGFALDFRALRRAGARERDARVRVLALGALEYCVLAPAAAACAILMLLHGPSVGKGFTLPWAICVPAGFVFALWAVEHRSRFRGRRGWRGGLGQTLDAIYRLRVLITCPRAHGLGVLGMSLYWLGDLLTLSAALRMFDGPVPIAPLVVGYATGYALTRRTLPLAGAGSVEALLPFALTWMTIPLAAAVPTVFAYRVCNLWIPVVPALAGVPALRRRERAAERADRAQLQRAA